MSWRQALLPRHERAEHHQAQDLEQHLRAGMRGVGGGIVLRRDLDDVAADDVEALQAAQDFQHFARGQPADFRRAGARREGRVEAVDVEGEVGRPVADDLSRLLDDGRDAQAGHFLGVDHGHAGLVGELPQIFGRAANADLDGARRVEHAVEHRVAERPAMVELGQVVGAAGVAMRVDVDHADRAASCRRPSGSDG